MRRARGPVFWKCTAQADRDKNRHTQHILTGSPQNGHGRQHGKSEELSKPTGDVTPKCHVGSWDRKGTSGKTETIGTQRGFSQQLTRPLQGMRAQSVWGFCAALTFMHIHGRCKVRTLCKQTEDFASPLRPDTSLPCVCHQLCEDGEVCALLSHQTLTGSSVTPISLLSLQPTVDPPEYVHLSRSFLFLTEGEAWMRWKRGAGSPALESEAVTSLLPFAAELPAPEQGRSSLECKVGSMYCQMEGGIVHAQAPTQKSWLEPRTHVWFQISPSSLGVEGSFLNLVGLPVQKHREHSQVSSHAFW